MRIELHVSARITALLIALALPVFLSGCDSKKIPSEAASKYTLGGTVNGLSGSLTLTNNGGDARTVTTSGAFTFATSLTGGASYNVAVSAQPATQTCTAASGSGTIAASNVTTVAVNCVTNTYTVGGAVTGLTGTGLVLQNNGSDNLARTASGAFVFATPLANGTNYGVTVATQPTNQICTVTNATGAIASANVVNVAIACETFRVTASIGASGGTVNGPDGVQVVIPPGALNQATTIGIARNSAGVPTPFLLDVPTSGSTYELTPHDTLFSKPVLVRFPVAAGTASASLAISSFDLGWALVPAFVNGAYAEVERNTFSWFTLIGACYLDGIDPYPCAHPRGYSFVTATPANSITLTSGTSAVVTSGPGSANGSAGTWAVNSSSVTTLHFTLFYNGAPDCSNGRVTFGKLRPGTTGLSIVDQPTTPNVNGDGRVTLDLTPQQLDLDSVGTSSYGYAYHCTRPGYGGHSSYTSGGGDWITLNASTNGVPGFTLGGTISGLGSASGLELRNAVRDTLPVQPGSTTFTFGTAIVPGLPYSVTVLNQPAGRHCTVQNGLGTVAADVSNIAVACVPTMPPATGDLVLVPNTGSNNISIYRRDATNGTLTANGTAATGLYPFSIVVTPDGKYAYVGNLAAGSISSFSIDKTAGTLTSIAGSTPGTTNPYGVAMDPLGRFIWVANYSTHTASAFAINATTGALTFVGSYATGTFPYAIAVHPNGTHVYVVNQSSNSVSMFSVNSSTGALTSIGTPASAGLSPGSITVTPNAKFAYALNNTNISRFTINPGTGALTSTGFTTVIGSSSSGTAHGITVHPNGNFLYACNQNSVLIYAIDSATGNLTLLGTPTATGSGTNGLALDPTGEFLYTVNATTKTVSSFSVDSVTGAISATGTLATGNAPQGIAAAP